MLRRTVRKMANALLNPLGMEMVRVSRDLDDFLEPGKHRDTIFRYAAAAAEDWLRTQAIAPQRQAFDVEREVRGFFDAYLASPFREPHGGSRIGNLLWLNLLAKAFAPDVIVDSGTFKGASAWALARGNPQARIFSFDIDMSHLLLRVPGVAYIESDWTGHSITGQNMLCYFDDHVDQCRRVREAVERGVSVAVFDDDYDVTQFAPMAHGGFSLPKLSFCFDESLQDGEVITWREGGRRHEWTVPGGELDAVRGMVERYQRLPDISTPFGVDQMPYSIAALRRGAARTEPCGLQSLAATKAGCGSGDTLHDRQDRFIALDSWRGIAALGVAISHFPIIAVSHLTVRPVVENLPLFVDFFFVLSGFVISFAYWEKLKNWSELKLFALRRFARLWPLHVATLLPLVLLNLVWLARGRAAFQSPDSWQTLVGNLALVQGFISPKYSWNGQSWSISVEFWAYFVFAALCLWLPRRYARPAAAAVIALSGIKMLFFFGLFSQALRSQLFFRCLFGFFSGQCVYFLWRSKPFRAAPRQATAIEIASLLAVIGLFAFMPADTPLFLLHPLVFGALVWVFASEAGRISTILLKPFPRLLGRLSYSLYMVHMLVLAFLGSPLRHWGQTLAQDKLAGDGLLALFLVLTVALSWATFQAIEKPGTRLFGPRRAPHLPG